MQSLEIRGAKPLSQQDRFQTQGAEEPSMLNVKSDSSCNPKLPEFDEKLKIPQS